MHLVKALKGRNLTVLTNAINIAMELTQYETVQVIVAGGSLQQRSYELVGHIADRAISDFFFDIALMGVDGISLDRGISTFTIGEAHTSLQYIEHAKSVWVLADHSKIGKTAPALIAPLGRVARLITDGGIDAESKKAFEGAGIEVLVAD
jgi:DeoR family transcriptional regulator, aga operon transcriptional repressor